MATKELILNKITLLTGFIGIISLYIFNYTDIDLEPFFYTSLYNWKYCHWVCYLYIAYLFIWFLKKSYLYITPYKLIQKGIVLIGKYSYYIYLFQIIYYATICYYVSSTLSSFIENHFIERLAYIIISTIICIIPVVCFKRVYQYTHDKERKR
jgi:peptidoglycan/LPS O-acetylase OafA/YrhL